MTRVEQRYEDSENISEEEQRQAFVEFIHMCAQRGRELREEQERLARGVETPVEAKPHEDGLRVK